MREHKKEEQDLRERALAWRNAADLTQVGVSLLLGLSMNAYGQWERGRSSQMQRKNKEKLQSLMSAEKPRGTVPADGLREVTCAECFTLTILTWRGNEPAKFCVWCGKPLKL